MGEVLGLALSLALISMVGINLRRPREWCYTEYDIM